MKLNLSPAAIKFISIYPEYMPFNIACELIGLAVDWRCGYEEEVNLWDYVSGRALEQEETVDSWDRIFDPDRPVRPLYKVTMFGLRWDQWEPREKLHNWHELDFRVLTKEQGYKFHSIANLLFKLNVDVSTLKYDNPDNNLILSPWLMRDCDVYHTCSIKTEDALKLMIHHTMHDYHRPLLASEA